MAWYTINYACGHGSTEKQLYGKHDSRDEYVEWAERTMVCPECYRLKMREQAKAEIVTAEYIHNPFSAGHWLAITKGDTYSIKDALRAAGCRWREYIPQGDILGMSRPKKAWMLQLADTDGARTAQIMALQKAGVQQFKIDQSPFAQIAHQVATELEARHA